MDRRAPSSRKADTSGIPLNAFDECFPGRKLPKELPHEKCKRIAAYLSLSRTFNKSAVTPIAVSSPPALGKTVSLANKNHVNSDSTHPAP